MTTQPATTTCPHGYPLHENFVHEPTPGIYKNCRAAEKAAKATLEQERTPAPWRDTFSDSKYSIDHVIKDASDEWVANAFRNAANARLITAAPDLLAALRELTDLAHCAHARECIHHVAGRAAMAKADAR